jgi:putative ABC transport system substrate-binding protein
MIGRRSLVGGLAACLALPAAAQHRGVRVGFIGLATEESDRSALEALREGLGAASARRPAAEVFARHANGDLARAAAFIREATASGVDVFVSPGPAMTRLMHRLTTTPIVAIGLTNLDGDLFESIAKPGGRVTGFATFGEDLADKRVALLRELIPALRAVGVMHNDADPNFAQWGGQTVEAIRRAGLRAVQVGLRAVDPDEVHAGVARIAAEGAQALVVVRDFVTSSAQASILAAATRSRVAVMAEVETFVEQGALASFGTDIPDLFRRAAGFVRRIADGAAAGDLPIETPVKFLFVLNLRTAQALGLTIPPLLLARADEVVE